MRKKIKPLLRDQTKKRNTNTKVLLTFFIDFCATEKGLETDFLYVRQYIFSEYSRSPLLWTTLGPENLSVTGGCP